MSDSVPQSTQSLPEAIARPPGRFKPSLVWLIPLLALLIGVWLAFNAWRNLGPQITIQFASGTGIEPGKTRIKFRAVDVGEVTAVTLSPDRHHIEVTARLAKETSSYLMRDTRFWVVQPRIAGSTVSGLDTLFSGAYIAMDTGKSTEPSEHFTGLDEAPIVFGDRPGHRFVLQADDLGSLETGSPVFYRRVQVGQVVGYRLTPNGNKVQVTVFINKPYDQFVNIDSRFWQASGIDVSVGADGVKFNAQSLVSLALGGVAFDNMPATNAAMPTPAPDNQAFTLFANRESAMRRLESQVSTFIMRVSDSVRGLSVGAPVDFRGIVIGEVAGMSLNVANEVDQPQIDIRLHIYPEKLYAMAQSRSQQHMRRLSIQKLVARGLRAQLRSGSLLTGQLYVGLDYFPDTPPQQVGLVDGIPLIPSVPSEFTQLQTSLMHIAKSIDRMKLDETASATRHTLFELDRTLQQSHTLISGLNQQGMPAMLKTLDALQKALATASQSLRADSPLQSDLRSAAQQVDAAARSVRSLSDSLNRHPESLLTGRAGDKRQ